jgi:hypothetical protein
MAVAQRFTIYADVNIIACTVCKWDKLKLILLYIALDRETNK